MTGGAFATTKKSKQLDQAVKKAAHKLAREFASQGVICRQKIDNVETPGGGASCAPDGGLWYINGKILASFEAKYQGKRGNADERWHKNWNILRILNENIIYVTFAAGESVHNQFRKNINIALYEYGNDNKFNQTHLRGPSLYLDEAGFTDKQVEDIMRSVIKYTLNKYHDTEVNKSFAEIYHLIDNWEKSKGDRAKRKEIKEKVANILINAPSNILGVKTQPFYKAAALLK